jgi:hypothetical protein
MMLLFLFQNGEEPMAWVGVDVARSAKVLFVFEEARSACVRASA